MITGLYAAFFAVFQMMMIPWIVKTRAAKKVSLGDGGIDLLARKTRVYGNFVETVPSVLLLMLIAELSGGPLWYIHWIGSLMILSRLIHAYGMIEGDGVGPFRAAGMMLTMTSIFLGAVLCGLLGFKIF